MFSARNRKGKGRIVELRSWDKNQRLSIGSMARLFGINASTLRFWEKEGLLRPVRNRGNNYRDFDYQALLDISDLLLMKSMGMSLESMRESPRMSLAGFGALYASRSDAIAEQIQRLEEVLGKVKATRELMREFNAICSAREVILSDPDVLQIIAHKKLDDPVAWRKYFAGQYQFGTVFLPDGSDGHREIWGWVPARPDSNEESIWSYQPGQHTFALCAMWVNVEDRRKNNVEELRAFYRSFGHSTGMIVARYVCTAFEHGLRSDYYKAWIELAGSPDSHDRTARKPIGASGQ